MASELITKFEEFDVSSFKYGKLTTNSRGGKSIKIRNSKNNTLILSTPLILTWGANKMVDEDTGKVSYNLSIQYPSGEYGTPSSRKFFELMKEFENRILEDAVEHGAEWFNKPNMSREVAEALFNPILKYPKNKETKQPDYTRAPTTRVKIPYWEGKFNVELYDVEKNPIFTPEMDLGNIPFESLIPKSSHIAGALQCNGIYFAAGMFGVTWQLSQAIIRPPARLRGGCFINLSGDDRSLVKKTEEREAEEAQEHTQSGVSEDNTNVTDTVVEDSDDDIEPVVEEPKPKPKKKVTKRKVVKKKKSA